MPLATVWGRNDEIFARAGARAFLRDLPDAEVHLLDGGHFLLESRLDTVVGCVRGGPPGRGRAKPGRRDPDERTGHDPDGDGSPPRVASRH